MRREDFPCVVVRNFPTEHGKTGLKCDVIDFICCYIENTKTCLNQCSAICAIIIF